MSNIDLPRLSNGNDPAIRTIVPFAPIPSTGAADIMSPSFRTSGLP
jgi:hypothetical protein